MNDFQDLLRTLVEGDDSIMRNLGLGEPSKPGDPGVGDGDGYLPLGGAAANKIKAREFGEKGPPDTWGSEKSDAQRMGRVGKRVGDEGDATEALKQWATAHAEEYNALKSRIYITLRVLKEVYATLGTFTAQSGTQVDQARRKDNSSALAAMKAQFQATMQKPKPGAPAPAPQTQQPQQGGV